MKSLKITNRAETDKRVNKISFKKFLAFLTLIHGFAAFSGVIWSIVFIIPVFGTLMSYVWIGYGVMTEKAGVNICSAASFLICLFVYIISKIKKQSAGLVFTTVLTILNMIFPYVGNVIFNAVMSV